MFRRIAALACATAGIIAVVGWFLLLGSSPQISLAQVLDRVAKTRSVTFKESCATIPGQPAGVVRGSILADGLVRMDMPDGYFTVMDTKSGTALCVSPKEKTARIMMGIRTPPINIYEMLRNIISDKSPRLPDEMIEGRKANVFRVEPNEEVRKQSHGLPCPAMKVWVDPSTKLPIRMEPIVQDPKDPMVMYDFVFDKPLDRSLFSLTPPAGYKVTTVGKPATWQEKPLAAKELLSPVVIPGVGMGPVKFGMSRDEVVKLLGKPDDEERGSLAYPSRGYTLSVSPVRERGLVAISFISQQECSFKVRDFAGKTKEGIGIGSSLKDIEKAFGKP
ncbi:MAG: hypothetical protein ABFC96_09840, partial [Thermoguttaceae bacterium]